MEDCRFLLREKAKVRLPDITRDESDYLVAVFSHHKRVEDAQPTDFMWFKCRARHTVAKIQAFYTQKSGCRAALSFGSYIPEDDVKLNWLDHWGDKLIVLQAVANKAHADDNVSRTPLQPLNGPSVSSSIEPMVRSLKDTVKPSSSPISSVTVPDLLKPAQGRPGAFGGPQPTLHIPPGPTIIKFRVDTSQHAGEAFSRSQDRTSPAQPPAPSQWQSPYSQVPLQSPCVPFGSPFSNVFPASGSSNILPDHRQYMPHGQRLNPPATYVSSSIAEVPTATVVPIPNASQNRRIQRILAESSPELLEIEVESNVRLLDQLETHLTNLPVKSPEAEQWLQQIKNLRLQNVNEPTIIGVVGNTGAGKSSVINAMLDEERLVPTNCMRACTAVVTEMSWNSSDDENAKYRAAIEFIKPEEWEKELQILFGEVLDASGNFSREAYNEDSEAGVAYAKIRAVYPLKTKDEISKSSVPDLIRDPAVCNVLGQTRNIQEARSDKFYRVLQSYVDSKEKSTDDKKRREMEFWPLIKVVKIYTKADALSTGAVIVDLPGVSDSNAARSAIASNYMKQCTGLWIVAPITRAVDDKAAKSLLGESFKRQLKYDGTYSRVTFICSKTDDILITEASGSLGLEEEIGAKWNRSDEIKKSQNQLIKGIEDLKESKAVFGEVLNDMDDQIEAWEKTRDDWEDGKTVYAPKMNSKKRKHSQKSSTQRKKRMFDRNDDDTTDDDSDDDVVSSQEESQTSMADQGEPLTEEIIEAKIAELKATKKEARSQRKQLDARILDLRREQEIVDSAYAKIQAEMSQICISGRNQYSKGAIQQDFAAGIKELDQENQLEVNEEEFNPDEDLRDYAEVARSLPVFCVSSRAYQKLSGRLQREKDVPGFTNVEETEIPQLQAHCKKLTEAGRASTCRRFLNGFSQLLNSLSFWASNDGSRAQLSDTQRAAEAKFLHVKLAQLEKGLEQAVKICLEDMKDTLTENIYEKFDKVIQAAVDEANITAAKWGSPVNRENRSAGGYPYATYKAICRRDGVFSNAHGAHDFNLQLSEPMMKQLGSDWEKAFTRQLPHVLQSFNKSIQGLLQSFHKDIQARAIKSGTSIAGIAMLGQQLEAYERIFKDLTGQMDLVIGERQRNANREFTPVIAKRLLSAYEYCVAERGTGSYMRMKEHMTSYVDQHRGTMFRESTEEVRKHLRQMCTQVEEQMMNKADEVFILMRRDYLTVIAGQHVPQGYIPPKWERSMKAEIAKLIQEREEVAEEEENAEKTTSGAEQDVNTNGPSSHTPLLTELGGIPGQAPTIGNIPNSAVDTTNQRIKNEFEY